MTWDLNRIDYAFIPQNRLKDMGYNGTWESKLKTMKKLKALVPNKGDPYEYNQRMTAAFVEVPLLITLLPLTTPLT